ncbi:MAG: copper chaperone PCu(A)C [Halieaceae bacterium]|nr:copper chaperone PCu(A)C [Halieaceae bacterium]
MRHLFYAGLIASLAPLAVVAAGPGSLGLDDAWVRALPPGQPNTAAYLVVTNSADTEVTIIGATSPLAETVEIHTSREVDGLQRMERLEQVQVAPGQSVAFAPGGKHLMLLGLGRMPAPGEVVQLCLQLAKGGEVCTLAGVRKGTGGEQTHQHHQH